LSSSSEEEYHQYKIFKKQTSIAAENDPKNKGHLHESKLLGALNMYTKKALLQR
jgi:hypothetical protein